MSWPATTVCGCCRDPIGGAGKAEAMKIKILENVQTAEPFWSGRDKHEANYQDGIHSL